MYSLCKKRYVGAKKFVKSARDSVVGVSNNVSNNERQETTGRSSRIDSTGIVKKDSVSPAQQMYSTKTADFDDIEGNTTESSSQAAEQATIVTGIPTAMMSANPGENNKKNIVHSTENFQIKPKVEMPPLQLVANMTNGYVWAVFGLAIQAWVAVIPSTTGFVTGFLLVISYPSYWYRERFRLQYLMQVGISASFILLSFSIYCLVVSMDKEANFRNWREYGREREEKHDQNTQNAGDKKSSESSESSEFIRETTAFTHLLETWSWIGCCSGFMMSSSPLFTMLKVWKTGNTAKLGSLSMNIVCLLSNVIWWIQAYVYLNVTAIVVQCSWGTCCDLMSLGTRVYMNWKFRTFRRQFLKKEEGTECAAESSEKKSPVTRTASATSATIAIAKPKQRRSELASLAWNAFVIADEDIDLNDGTCLSAVIRFADGIANAAGRCAQRCCGGSGEKMSLDIEEVIVANRYDTDADGGNDEKDGDAGMKKESVNAMVSHPCHVPHENFSTADAKTAVTLVEGVVGRVVTNVLNEENLKEDAEVAAKMSASSSDEENIVYAVGAIGKHACNNSNTISTIATLSTVASLSLDNGLLRESVVSASRNVITEEMYNEVEKDDDGVDTDSNDGRRDTDTEE